MIKIQWYIVIGTINFMSFCFVVRAEQSIQGFYLHFSKIFPYFLNSAVNRIYPAKLRIPNPHHQPPTMSLEVEEMTAVQKKWKCFCPARKPLLTSHLFYVPSSEPLGLIFWLALHSRSCKMSSLLSTPSFSGKAKAKKVLISLIYAISAASRLQVANNN